MWQGMKFGFAAMMVVAATAARAESLTVTARSVADEKAVFATVESTSVVPARSRIGGTIIALEVREGSAVERGERIATVADDKLALQLKSLDAQIRALQAQASQAQIDFTRVEGLVERGTLPRVKLDEVRTALNVAENGLRAKTAERAVIQQQAEEGQVLAPAAGRVLRRQAVAGSVVLPGDPIVMIAQQDFKLRLRVPERHARLLKAGDRIRIDGEAFADRQARTGTVDLVYPQIEDGRVIADARFDNPREYFVGDRLRVWISGGERSSFVVPAPYIMTRFGVDYVQLKRNGVLANVPVQRGRPLPSAAQPDGVEILSGVRAGDELVRP
jgi:RND family efflux transporter MFP subunit